MPEPTPVCYTSIAQGPDSVSLQGNPILFTLASSYNVAGSTDVNIVIVLQRKTTIDWENTDKQDMLPVVDGVATFDVSGWLENELQPAFTFPDHWSNVALPHPGMMTTFRLKAYDRWIDEYGEIQTTYDNAITSSQYWVIPGGLAPSDQMMLNELSTFWWTEHKADITALNWLPGPKTTRPGMPEKLYWLSATPSSMTLQARWTAIDSSTGVTTLVTQDDTEMLELCVSADIIEHYVGKPLDSYTIEVVGTPYSQDYIVDREEYTYPDQLFIFQNSFGCYETACCRGARSGKLDINRKSYEKKVLLMQFFDRQVGNKTLSVNKKHSSNIGYFDSEWIDWWMQFLGSEDVFLIDGFNLHPVVINSDSIDFEDLSAKDDLPSMSFEWEYSRKNRFVSSLGYILDPANLYPPFYAKLDAFFKYLKNGSYIDVINGLTAALTTVSPNPENSEIAWPEIIGNDLFDFSDTDYWAVGIQSLAWYDPSAVRTAPISFLDQSLWAELGTDKTHARLFHLDYSSAFKDIIPVLVYASDLSQAEQDAVVEWLGWYQTIWEESYILTEESTPIIQ